jgi:DNA-directed RNA polymerase specialized sigma24 family protein
MFTGIAFASLLILFKTPNSWENLAVVPTTNPLSVPEQLQPHGANPAGSPFLTTHWSAVLAARDEKSPRAAEALAQLCRTYWFPLYAYVRRCGESPEQAQDLTQEFFARLLAKDWLRAASPARGRFRWFLLASLKHFLANEWDRTRALKRGGGQQLMSLDALDPEARYALEPADHLSADKLYDRTWALRLLDVARARLRDESTSEDREARFEALEQFLPGQESSTTYVEIAALLGVAEGTIKASVSRLRRRYGELLREEVAKVVGSMTDVDDELHNLIEALG